MKKKWIAFIAVMLCVQLYGCSESISEKETPAITSEEESSSKVDTSSAENTETNNQNDLKEDEETVDSGAAGNSDDAEGTDRMTDTDYYSVATGISASEVESYAAYIKQCFLAHDCEALSAELLYPMTIAGNTYEDSAEFLEASEGFEQNLSSDFFAGLEEEDCRQMFCNWQGIMMGSTGEVWLTEVLDEDDNSQGLKVSAINGMLE